MKNLLFTFIICILSLSLWAQSDILPPQLVAPTNGDDDQMPDVELDWYPSAGVGSVMYEVQLDTSESFTDPVIFETHESAYEMSQLQFLTTYYWRVRATDDIETSDWSETYSFMTLGSIILHGPDDGDTSGLPPSTRLLFKVKLGPNLITGITHYVVQYSLDTNFTTIYGQGSVQPHVIPATAQNYGIYTQQLLFDTTYYWRARVRHQSDTSLWSEVWSFQTMVSPTLTAPEDGATDQMLDALVKWDHVPGAFEYLYEICPDPNFNLPCLNVVDTNLTNAKGLMFGKTYYWRVSAAHNMDTSAWTGSRSFVTINTVPLESPENGSYVPQLNPILNWTQLTGISGYELHYGTDEMFADPEVYIINSPAHSFQVLQPTTNGITYYWKVRAFEDGDTTNWSPTWNFISGENPSGINDMAGAYDVSIFPNPCNDKLNIKIDAIKQTPVAVSVINLLGKSMLEKEVMINQGENKERIDVSGFAEGVYLLRIKSGENSFTQRFVINR